MHLSPLRPLRHPRRPVGWKAGGFVLLLALSFACAQEVPTSAVSLLDAIVESLRGGGQRAILDMTVIRGDEETRYEIEMISDGTERSLTRVLAPPREAGQAFLVDGNELFIYAPRLGRALRLPPSGRSDGFLGSDLSYDDLAGDEVRDTYEATILERTDREVILSLTPLPGAATPYGELRFRASLPDLAPQDLTYFDQRDTAVKRLRLSDYRVLEDGRSVPLRFEVEDLTEGGGRTVASWRDAVFDVTPPDACFTLQALERGCAW